MNDEQLIRRLKEQLPGIPQAPAGEWARIARKSRPWHSLGGYFFSPAYAWGMGLAMAGLTLAVVPLFRPAPQPVDQASLEPFLAELKAEFNGGRSTADDAPEEGYLALVDAVH